MAKDLLNTLKGNCEFTGVGALTQKNFAVKSGFFYEFFFEINCCFYSRSVYSEVPCL